MTRCSSSSSPSCCRRLPPCSGWRLQPGSLSVRDALPKLRCARPACRRLVVTTVSGSVVNWAALVGRACPCVVGSTDLPLLPSLRASPGTGTELVPVKGYPGLSRLLLLLSRGGCGTVRIGRLACRAAGERAGLRGV